LPVNPKTQFAKRGEGFRWVRNGFVSQPTSKRRAPEIDRQNGERRGIPGSPNRPGITEISRRNRTLPDILGCPPRDRDTELFRSHLIITSAAQRRFIGTNLHPVMRRCCAPPPIQRTWPGLRARFGPARAESDSRLRNIGPRNRCARTRVARKCEVTTGPSHPPADVPSTAHRRRRRRRPCDEASRRIVPWAASGG
jgi:hypothetical protein